MTYRWFAPKIAIGIGLAYLSYYHLKYHQRVCITALTSCHFYLIYHIKHSRKIHEAKYNQQLPPPPCYQAHAERLIKWFPQLFNILKLIKCTEISFISTRINSAYTRFVHCYSCIQVLVSECSTSLNK